MKKEVFIERAIAIHGNKFDYSLLPDEFKTKEKVPVRCETHGVFLLTTDNHIHNKRGCPTCGAIGRSLNNRDTLESVIETLDVKFKDLRIDYSDYVDKNSLLKVACLCGNFFTSTTKDLLRTKYGCTSCSLVGRGLTRRKPLEDFIRLASKVHKGKYGYDKVELNTYQEKVEIICNTHGSFWQSPTVHVKGHGCPKCATGWDCTESEYTFYVLKVGDNMGKVGITTNFKVRFEILNRKNRLKAEVIKIFTSKDAQYIKDLEYFVIHSPEIPFSVASKHDCPDGYTETFYLKDLDKVLARVSSYKDVM